MNEKRKNNIYKSLMLIIITALITSILTTIAVYSSVSEKNTELDNKIAEINKKIKATYIGDIDESKLIEGALEGYVAAVGDEYTEYLTESEINDLKEEVDGSYVGIGVYITQLIQTNEIMVIGVIKDSPAEKVGIIAGDIIKKVNDVEYVGEQLTAASNKMRGPEGENVKVTVVRDEKEIECNITREKIKFNYVSSEILENNIGYIKLSSFEGNCAKDFEKHYNDLQSKGIKSLIIDLRNNGGGLVDQSLEIADLIVPKGATTLITTDKNHNEEVSKAKKDPIINMPIVILVNEYTASASEILTGAIKENVNAKVVGTTTYGKGIIQGIYLLKDKKTGLKVTIQEYFTPNRNKIHKTGITPDYEVELPEEWKGKNTIDKEFDTQLIKAIEILK